MAGQDMSVCVKKGRDKVGRGEVYIGTWEHGQTLCVRGRVAGVVGDGGGGGGGAGGGARWAWRGCTVRAHGGGAWWGAWYCGLVSKAGSERDRFRLTFKCGERDAVFCEGGELGMER